MAPAGFVSFECWWISSYISRGSYTPLTECELTERLSEEKAHQENVNVTVENGAEHFLSSDLIHMI